MRGAPCLLRSSGGAWRINLLPGDDAKVDLSRFDMRSEGKKKAALSREVRGIKTAFCNAVVETGLLHNSVWQEGTLAQRIPQRARLGLLAACWAGSHLEQDAAGRRTVWPPLAGKGEESRWQAALGCKEKHFPNAVRLCVMRYEKT